MTDQNQNPTGAESIGAREKVFGINKKILPFAVGGVGLAVAVIVGGIFSSTPEGANDNRLPATAGYVDKSAVKSEEDRKAEAEHVRDAVANLAANDSKNQAGWWAGYQQGAAPAPTAVPNLGVATGPMGASSAPAVPLSAQVPALSAVTGTAGAGKPTPAQVAAAKAVADQAAATPALPTQGGSMVAGAGVVDQAAQERFQRESQARSAGLGVQISGATGGGNTAMPGGMSGGNALAQLRSGGAGGDTQLASMQGALNQLRGNGLPGQGPIDDAAKKEAWQGRQGAQKPEYLTEVKHAGISDTMVVAGSVIPAVLISGVNSELPGQLIAQVRQDVYDSTTGRSLLIPKGTKLIGVYDSNVAFGQKRLLIAWTRLLYNDGTSFNLKGMPGSDASGLAGLGDQVDNHYGRIFGGAIVMSMISAGAQLSQGQTATTAGQPMSASQTVAASLGQQLGQVGMAMVQKNMQIAPTLEIRQGFAFNVTVTADLALPAVKKI